MPTLVCRRTNTVTPRCAETQACQQWPHRTAAQASQASGPGDTSSRGLGPGQADERLPWPCAGDLGYAPGVPVPEGVCRVVRPPDNIFIFTKSSLGPQRVSPTQSQSLGPESGPKTGLSLWNKPR